MLIAKQVTVFTVLISAVADAQLLDVAASTHGIAYFDTGADNSTDLVDAFRTIAAMDDTALPGTVPVQVGLLVAITGLDIIIIIIIIIITIFNRIIL